MNSHIKLLLTILGSIIYSLSARRVNFSLKNLDSTILEYLAAGESVENILNAYPILEAEDIKACLEFAKKLTDKSIIAYGISPA